VRDRIAERWPICAIGGYKSKFSSLFSRPTTPAHIANPECKSALPPLRRICVLFGYKCAFPNLTKKIFYDIILKKTFFKARTFDHGSYN
jgi:hypothetical protein